MSDMIDQLTSISNRHNRLRSLEENHRDNKSSGSNYYMLRGLVPVRVIFVPGGSYHDVVRRSFEFSATDDDGYALTEALERHGTIDPYLLAGIANDVISPSMDIDKNIDINDGWQEARFHFFMEFKKNIGHGGVIYYCYTGYTDTLGISENGDVDPEMVLHITNAIYLTEQNGRNKKLINDIQVMTNERYRVRNGRYDPEYIMDPYTMVSEHQVQTMLEHELEDGETAHPSYATLGRYITETKRAHNSPSHLLSGLTSARLHANDRSDTIEDDLSYGGDSHSRINRTTLSLLSKKSLREDPFLALFREETDIMNSASVSWQMLCEYFPLLEDDRIVEVIFPEEVRQDRDLSSVFSRGMRARDSEEWTGANIETIIAEKLTQQLPNFMISELIQSVSFTVTNEMTSTIDEDYVFVYGNSEFDDIDNRTSVVYLVDGLTANYEVKLLMGFENKIKRLLLDQISHHGQIDLSLTVRADLFGEFNVAVSINGGPEERFVRPTYSNSMASSLLTTDVDHFSNLSTNILNFVDSSISNLT